MFLTKKYFFWFLLVFLSLTLSVFESKSDLHWHSGKASYYSKKLKGRRTSSGEKHNPRAFTAAHRTLAMGTWVEVKSTKTDRITFVRINDRGPHKRSRMIDISYAAAKELGILRHGISEVLIRPIYKEDMTDSLKNYLIKTGKL
ncbi:septal ring lytic transglycosylase RlpA family protein [Sandaracinomonas limnophila]|uniref:Probable endolytic peptidoglycan transglycosylase RlpA n=1 Tax=Sandaracinomonas limnophila TaxID=1862386 RepID=A0A437PXH7_9BACT|nr:septal ring lytic transglycosylase RlpA family protein [Sandaracinomonas limnophila]RVU26952.1 septal ring lytic transglycosylase RlpA family protein [Sandaracinomonas limnophila]